MPTEVEVAGQGVYVFPDEVGEDEIQSILRKQFPVEGFKDTTPDQPFVAATPSQPIPPEQLTTYGGPPKQWASAAETMVEPVAEMMQPRVTLPRMETPEGESAWKTYGKSAVNVLAGLPEFLSSNAGLGGMVAGAAAPVATAAAFSADMLHALYQQGKQAYKNWDSMTDTQKRVAITEMAGTGAFAALTGAHAGRGVADKIQPTRPVIRELSKQLQKEPIAPIGEQAIAPIERAAVPIVPPEADRMSAPFEGKLPSEPSIPAPEKLDLQPVDTGAIVEKTPQNEQGHTTGLLGESGKGSGIGEQSTASTAAQAENAGGILASGSSKGGAEGMPTGRNIGELTPDQAIKSGASPSDYSRALETSYREGKITDAEFLERSSTTHNPENWTTAKVGDQVWDDYNRRLATVKDVSIGKVTLEKGGKEYLMTPDYIRNPKEYAERRIRNNQDVPKELAKFLEPPTPPVAEPVKPVEGKVGETPVEVKPYESGVSPSDAKLTPSEKSFRSTAPGQKAMASRASRIGLLHNLNEAIRKADPKEAYDRTLIDTLPDSQIDGMRDSLIQDYNKLVAKKPAPPKVETAGEGVVAAPVAAAAKVEAEVKAVAQTEGVRPAKEIKSELVSRLEKAIEDAPSEKDLPAIGEKGKTPTEGDLLSRRVSQDKITIEIPGDGVFTVFNTKEALSQVLWRANQITTNPNLPVRVKTRGTSAEDRAFVQQALKEAQEQPTQPITQGPGAEIVGMGGATPSELTARTPMQSAIKNSAVDRDRIDRGELPMMDALKKGDPELWSQAMNVIDQDWAAADKLIARHKANPFIPTDVETMVLLHRRVDLKNEFNKAHQESLLAEKEGRGEAAESAKAVRDSMGDKLLELEEVMGKGDRAMGTMAGRAFRARQLVMNEDFSMADLMSLRESDLGRKLSRDEIAQLQKISDENARLNNEFAALLEAHEKNQAAADMRKAVADSEARNKQQPYHPRILELAEGYAKKWDERGAQALTDLKAMFGEGQAFSGAPISPAMLDKAIIYGTSKIVRGAVDFAKWSDAMIRDLGPGFKDHAKAVWDASKKAFDADVASTFKKQGTATVQRVKGALKGADLGNETILKKIQRKVEESKGLLPDLKYHLDKLLDFYVRKGLKEEGPLLDAIHKDVQKVIPDLTRRETREILAGYGSFKPLSKDAVSVIKRDMHGQWQEISKIDMIQRGIFPPKLQERATMTDKQRWLRKQYEEQKRLHPEVTPLDPETQLKTALQAAKTRVMNQITDLEHQIQTRTKIVKETKRLKPDAELERLTAIRDEMKAVYDTVFKKPELTDAERLEIWKERTRDRIAELTEKVKNKDFQPRKKPEPLKYDKEAQRIRFELHKVHRALLDLRYNDRMSKRNATQKAFDAVANAVWFQRAMMTTGEFSGVLRQGGALAYQNPTIAIKNLKPMMEAFKSEKAQFEIMEEILTRDNAPLYEKYGLEFTEAGTRLSSMEEHFMFRLSENMQKQPGLKQLVGTVNKFQRAYTVFLNKMRADVFDAMADTWGKDPVTLEQIANAINVFSGRGSKGVGKFLGSGQLANTVAFAPKYAISRIQILAGQPMWRGNLHTRKMIAWQYLKMLRGPAALYALGTLMGGKVGTDSNSSDFGKLIVGNTRIDPWMGILQPAVLFSRLGTGKKTTAAGKSVPIRGKVPYGGDNAWDLISDFGRGKLSPSVGSTVSVLSGEDPIGQPFGVTDALKTTFYPMTYRDIIKLYGEHGIPEATAISTLAILGVGANTYDRQKKSNQTPW